jgi:hypothetical protein
LGTAGFGPRVRRTGDGGLEAGGWRPGKRQRTAENEHENEHDV